MKGGPNPSVETSPGLPSLLIVYNGTTAGGQGIGGGDQVILKFIRFSGFIADLIVPRSARHLIQPHGQLYLTCPNLGAGLAPMLWLYFVRTLQGLARARQTGRYDVALAVSAIAVDLLPLWCTRARRKGVIIYHLLPDRKGVNWQTRLRFWLAAQEHRLAKWLVERTCDFVVAGNEVTKHELETAFPRMEVVVHHAGFDADAIDRAPEAGQDRNQACFMGRLTSQKGIFDLLNVMEEINRAEPDFRLIMLGDGPDRPALAAEIQRRNISTVELKGFVSDDEKYRLLKQSAFFFFPSYEEGWGIALAEALYCQAHCVCYELPHYRGIFQEFPAYAPIGDTAAFVQRFRERRLQPLPAGQKEFVRRYHDPQVVQELVQHLKRFAALPPRSF